MRYTTHMKVQDLQSIQSLHHAYIVTGPTPEGGGAVLDLLEKRGVDVKTNPDLIRLTYTDLLVDDARAISTYALLTSLGDSKYFVISFSKANDAAQNALLKVVEEAPGNSIFFFCTESIGGILPTLRSRSVHVTVGDTIEPDQVFAKEFLSLPYADRLSKIEKMVTASQKSQDRTPIRNFISELTVYAHGEQIGEKGLRELVEAARFLNLNGSSPKVVLSHLAVTLPILR